MVSRKQCDKITMVSSNTVEKLDFSKYNEIQFDAWYETSKTKIAGIDEYSHLKWT
jgi:hypothetical protein